VDQVLRRTILWILLVSAPAVLLSGFLVYQLNIFLASKWDIHVHPFLYQMTLLAVMGGAFWLSSGKLISELKASAEKRHVESSRRS
jgi:hypothetical protein